MTAAGRSINITLIFSLARYSQASNAYMSCLEALPVGGGDPSRVHSVASFFVSRVGTDSKYVDELVGADTVTTLTDGTIDALNTAGPWPAPSTSPLLVRSTRSTGCNPDPRHQVHRADQQSAIDTLETKVGELIPTRSTPDLTGSRATFEPQPQAAPWKKPLILPDQGAPFVCKLALDVLKMSLTT